MASNYGLHLTQEILNPIIVGYNGMNRWTMGKATHACIPDALVFARTLLIENPEKRPKSIDIGEGEQTSTEVRIGRIMMNDDPDMRQTINRHTERGKADVVSLGSARKLLRERKKKQWKWRQIDLLIHRRCFFVKMRCVTVCMCVCAALNQLPNFGVRTNDLTEVLHIIDMT